MADRMASMELRLMAAVTGSLEGVNVTALCRDAGTSTKTFYKWRARYEAEGLDGLQPRSRRPKSSPTRTSDGVEDRIVELRKWLAEEGFDAGAATIRWHLQRERLVVPSESTIWRMLVKRGFVTPAPRKRPRASWCRFAAAFPNEMWQIDGTDWILADETPAKIINVLDDCSRYLPASLAAEEETGAAAWAAFSGGVAEVGMPSRCLSDNGLAFSGKLRGFEVEFEKRLRGAGVVPITSRPFHPQTCGKVERFNQTVKKWLRQQPRAVDLASLQVQLDEFRYYYNHHRPHRAIGRVTPATRFFATARLTPAETPIPATDQHVALTVTKSGRVEARQWVIAIGAEYARRPAEVYLSGTHANVFIDGVLVRHVTLDPTRRYQPSGKPRGGRRPKPPA